MCSVTLLTTHKNLFVENIYFLSAELMAILGMFSIPHYKTQVFLGKIGGVIGKFLGNFKVKLQEILEKYILKN